MPTETRVRAERVEVRRSREAILAAAERHYALHEADLTMAELAKLAGVGSATLYRRYAGIDDVLRELYATQLQALTAVGDAVRAQSTGWDAIVALVTGIIETLQAHPAIQRLNRKMIARDADHSLTAQWDDELAAVVARAQAEGTLRPDVNANDITFGAFRIGGYSNLPPDERDRVLGRQTGILLDGLRAAGPPAPLPGTPVTPGDLQRIFLHEVEHPKD